MPCQLQNITTSNSSSSGTAIYNSNGSYDAKDIVKLLDVNRTSGLCDATIPLETKNFKVPVARVTAPSNDLVEVTSNTNDNVTTYTVKKSSSFSLKRRTVYLPKSLKFEVSNGYLVITIEKDSCVVYSPSDETFGDASAFTDSVSVSQCT